MQNGDLETQSKEDVVTPTKESRNPVAVEMRTAATESLSGATPEMAAVTAKSTPPLSGRERLRSSIESVWKRLRERRREAAAVVVLIVTAMVWFDSGSSETGSAPNSPNELDSFDPLLSDFETFGDVQGMQESADPFESSSQNSFDSGLRIPQSESTLPSDTFSAKSVSTGSGRSTPTTTARYPDAASAFNAPATQTNGDFGSGQQQSRKVKFAGRIQPAN